MLRSIPVGPARFKRVNSTPEYWLPLLDGPPPSEGWPAGWLDWPEVHEAHRRLFAFYCDEALSNSAPRNYEGRGIVIAAGGATYFTSAWCLVHSLRRQGCVLPVEVWHLGPHELCPVMRRLLESLGNVVCVDALEVADKLLSTPRLLTGWGLKPFAALHSRFEEVLFLDADQVPADDPTYLFDDVRYKSAGAVLWPDYLSRQGVDVTEEAFRAFGLSVPDYTRWADHPRPSAYRPVESGQFLVDKSKRLAELSLYQKLCEHEDFLYPSPAGKKRWLVYGDKSCALAAWLMCASARGENWDYASYPGNFVMPPSAGWEAEEEPGRPGRYKVGYFLQHDLDGKLIFCHRVQPHGDKLRFKGENAALGVPGEELVFDALEELRSLWNGRPWGAGGDESLCGRWVLLRGEEGVAHLELLPEGAVSGLDGVARWSLSGGVLALSGREKAVHLLGLDVSGGCWQNQKEEIALVRSLPQGWDLREPFDLVVFDSTVRLNEYRLPERFDPSDRVLDVGAHFGSFAHACLSRGAGHVFCVEPDPSNQTSLRKNLRRHRGKVILLPFAAGRSDTRGGSRLSLASLSTPEGAKHLAGGVVSPGPGDVLVLPFDELVLLATDGGRVRLRLVKLDCESSEYPCLLTSTTLGLVDEVVGEWHTSKHLPAWSHFGPEDLRRRLEVEGFAVEMVPNPNSPALGNFYARREKAKP